VPQCYVIREFPILLNFTRIREVTQSYYELRHVCPSISMDEVGSRYTEFFVKSYTGGYDYNLSEDHCTSVTTSIASVTMVVIDISR
jgi:hypothetical protein